MNPPPSCIPLMCLTHLVTIVKNLLHSRLFVNYIYLLSICICKGNYPAFVLLLCICCVFVI